MCPGQCLLLFYTASCATASNSRREMTRFNSQWKHENLGNQVKQKYAAKWLSKTARFAGACTAFPEY